MVKGVDHGVIQAFRCRAWLERHLLLNKPRESPNTPSPRTILLDPLEEYIGKHDVDIAEFTHLEVLTNIRGCTTSGRNFERTPADSLTRNPSNPPRFCRERRIRVTRLKTLALYLRTGREG